MFIIKYIPFLGLALIILIGCLIAYERRPSLDRAVVFGSLAVYLVCVAWLLFTRITPAISIGTTLKLSTTLRHCARWVRT